MAYANGRIPATALATIAPGNQLLKPTANAYKSLVLLGKVVGQTVKPAGGLGSAYRNWDTENIFYQASLGNKKDIALADLNPNSIIKIAAPGYSPHGTGTAIDLLFNGSASPNLMQTALAARCGFSRPFGNEDPNHFQHDGRTCVNGPKASDWIRILAHYYNSRHLGKTTSADQDGTFDKTKAQNFTWLVQAAGIKDGLYKVPPYKHDGIWGPHTDGVNAHYQNLLWNS